MTELIRELPRLQVNWPITSTTGLSAPICRYASRWFLPDLLTGPTVWSVNAHPAPDLRAQAFTRQNHVSASRANDGPPQPMTDATAALSPQTGFPATDEARTHLGRLPSSPDDGLRVHDPLRSLPATAALPATDEARTHLGRKAPTCPPTTGLGPLLPLLPLPAVSPYPFPKRHTSPVMTNDRVSPLSSLTPPAECRRNGSAIRQSISCGMPRRPARAYVRVFAAAS